MRHASYKLSLGALVLALASLATPAEVPSLEYQVKASYLYNFMQFVEWPDDVFPPSGKFNVCVLGAWRFGDALDALQGERVAGRELTFHRLRGVAAARGLRCHVLFVSTSAASEAYRRLRLERGMLTVGETPSFIERGGIISLVEVNGRIRFKVNQRAAREAGLMVSSRLLRLALER